MYSCHLWLIIPASFPTYVIGRPVLEEPEVGVHNTAQFCSVGGCGFHLVNVPYRHEGIADNAVARVSPAGFDDGPDNIHPLGIVLQVEFLGVQGVPHPHILEFFAHQRYGA